MNAVADFIGRLLLSAIFLMAGFNKIQNYAGTQGFMEQHGVPGLLLPVVIAAEIVLPILIIVGWQTRLAALGLAIFTLISGVLFHYVPGDQTQMIMLMKNIAIAGGLFVVAAHGAGAWSVEGRSRN